MMKKEEMFYGSKTFNDVDELKFPNISFFIEKSFDELSGKSCNQSSDGNY